MKKIILVISTILTFLACQKVEVELFHNTALINGEEWSWPKQRSNYFNNGIHKENVFIWIARHNQRNEERDIIIFNNIKEDLIGEIDTIHLESLKSGSSNHPDTPTAHFHLSGSDGDLTIGGYELLNSEVFPSWLILERVNNKVIKGQFQGLFVNAYEGVTYYLPDTLYITEGAFLAKKGQF